ncbi:MAG: LysR family transcriptional regulator [Marinobacter sp.]|uniref:LysR family transcriptional regulator n=1 Tax=Marinobacter sp. TaxID=50741 RepID=UPI00299DA741|nr:LysR family transcriptional regulator [Marinobacter sp.]MDX1633769.1 LysR family transcriptional regulator [Marinobacter sp.]
MVNLRDFDLNLLVIFKNIMDQRSISKAANELGLSPSAVSHALGRLRGMLNDQLFYRTAKGLEPTERAKEIILQVDEGLNSLSGAISAQQQFMPAASTRVFSMQVADYVSGFFLPSFARRIRTEAPNITIDILPFSITTDCVWDRVDVQIRLTPGRLKPKEVRSKRLMLDDVVVIMRPDHPAASEPMTPELYASLPHVKLSQSSTGTTVIDDALAERGLQRHSALIVSSWDTIPDLLMTTDLIAIAPSHLLSLDPRLKSLKSSPLPLEEVVFSFDLCWDKSSENESGHQWLCETVAEVFHAQIREIQK